MTSKTKKYVAVVGLTLKDGTRVEPGEPIDKPDKWLVKAGKVKEA